MLESKSRFCVLFEIYLFEIQWQRLQFYCNAHRSHSSTSKDKLKGVHEKINLSRTPIVGRSLFSGSGVQKKNNLSKLKSQRAVRNETERLGFFWDFHNSNPHRKSMKEKLSFTNPFQCIFVPHLLRDLQKVVS